jgi:hypothetical protein
MLGVRFIVAKVLTDSVVGTQFHVKSAMSAMSAESERKDSGARTCGCFQVFLLEALVPNFEALGHLRIPVCTTDQPLHCRG